MIANAPSNVRTSEEKKNRKQTERNLKPKNILCITLYIFKIYFKTFKLTFAINILLI